MQREETDEGAVEKMEKLFHMFCYSERRNGKNKKNATKEKEKKGVSN